MAATLIDGEAIAKSMLDELMPAIQRLRDAGSPPHLVAIRANEDAGSAWYARAQAEHCEARGVRYTLENLGGKATEDQILHLIHRRNHDPDISAILLHMPLPQHVQALRLTRAILPEKDAEGIHPLNLGTLLATGSSDPAPCTAMAAVELVKRISPDLRGKKALVIGRSAIVGKPAALLLLNLHATVVIAHSHSDVPALSREADVVIAATGAAGIRWNRYQEALAAFQEGKAPKPSIPDLSPLLRASMIKPGAIVIDVGVNTIPKGFDEKGEPLRNAQGKVAMTYVGDVAFEEVKEVAGFLTAPKGGTGPVTNAFLLRNTVHAALRIRGWL